MCLASQISILKNIYIYICMYSERCQETSSFTIVHLLSRTVHVQLHGAIQCTLDRGLGPKDSCQRKTIQRRAQTNDKQTAAEFYMVAEQGSW